MKDISPHHFDKSTGRMKISADEWIIRIHKWEKSLIDPKEPDVIIVNKLDQEDLGQYNYLRMMYLKKYDIFKDESLTREFEQFYHKIEKKKTHLKPFLTNIIQKNDISSLNHNNIDRVRVFYLKYLLKEKEFCVQNQEARSLLRRVMLIYKRQRRQGLLTNPQRETNYPNILQEFLKDETINKRQQACIVACIINYELTDCNLQTKEVKELTEKVIKKLLGENVDLNNLSGEPTTEEEVEEMNAEEQYDEEINVEFAKFSLYEE